MSVKTKPVLFSYQKPDQQEKLIASARISGEVHAAMLKMAEVQGYESISQFVADAIVEKVENVARAVIGTVQTKHTKLATRYN